MRQLEGFLRFLGAAETEIRFAALPVEEIVVRHGEELPFLRVCAARCENGERFTLAWRDGVRAVGRETGLSRADLSLLRGFGEGFGVSDTDGQLSHCALYAKLTEDNLKNAREEKTRKSKLYQTLGIFSGIAAALLLS